MTLHLSRFALFCTLGLAASIGAHAADQRTTEATHQEVRIGVLAYLGVDAGEAEWTSVRQRLREALPGRAVTLHYFKHDQLNHVAAARAVDFVITNPGHYIELESELGASRLLTLQSDASGSGLSHSEIAGAVVTLRNNTEIQSLADLRGRSIAIVGKEGFAGFQLPLRELQAQGVHLRDLGPLKTVGLPLSQVLDAVASGQVDAGFVRACLIESAPEWSNRFRVVDARPTDGFPCAASTRVYPNWPIATLKHTSPELAKAVTVALLEMTDDHGPMTWTVPADYQPVHELFRELKIGPYANLREPTVEAMLTRYWPWLAGLAFLLFAWVAYTVHVEEKVEARTSDLRDALRAKDELRTRLQHSTAQAEHMARLSALGEMSSTLAHELNQPLATIGNYSESLILRANAGQLTPEATRQAASEIADQANRAAQILRRVRGFSRKKSPHRQWVSPVQVVDDAIALFRGMLVQPPNVMLVDKTSASVRIQADVLQLQQILLNLLKNAFDASTLLPATRQEISVRIDNENDKLHISVTDSGAGIAEEARVRLFEPFFTTKENGLGLGLSICRSIAEAHSGRLEAHPSTSGTGTTFVLTLPCCDE